MSRKGEVTACTIIDSSGNDELDNAACNAIIRRARFTPARDENGNAAPSSYSNKVRWVLPKD